MPITAEPSMLGCYELGWRNLKRNEEIE